MQPTQGNITCLVETVKRRHSAWQRVGNELGAGQERLIVVCRAQGHGEQSDHGSMNMNEHLTDCQPVMGFERQKTYGNICNVIAASKQKKK